MLGFSEDESAFEETTASARASKAVSTFVPFFAEVVKDPSLFFKAYSLTTSLK